MFIIFLIFFSLLFAVSNRLFDSLALKIAGTIFLNFVILIPLGYILSFFNQIGNSLLWGFLAVVIAGVILFLVNPKFDFSFKPTFFKLQLSKIEKLIFGLLAFAFLYVNAINFLILLFGYPNEWDSMTGHLVKCAYYLQNGNMGLVNGTTWSIDYYPNALPSIQIFFYHIFGEKGFKIIHYLSYWMFIFSIYELSKFFTQNKKASLFALFLAGLLPTALVQQTTTETDLILTSVLSIVVLFLLRAKKTKSSKDLFLLAIALAVWISLKVTFLLIGPALALVFIYVILTSSWFRKKIPYFSLLFCIAFVIYVLPNGYLRNIQAAEKFSLGALSAPEIVMQWHGIENYSNQQKIKNFELNILRYSSDFLQLDGIRNTELGNELNVLFRYLPNKFFSNFDLERDEFWAVNPFKLMGNSKIKFYIERPYWGVISFGIFLPLIFLIAFKSLKNKQSNSLANVMILAAFVHFLSLCFSAPYDPIKGRYFMNLSVWLLPLSPIFYDFFKNKSYILFISFFVVWAAYGTVSFRFLYPISGPKSVFKTSRMEQLTISRPEILEAYTKYDEYVPEDAIVALGTQQENEDFVYPFWGEKFDRFLIPIHPFRQKVKPIPSEAEYLLFSKGVIAIEKEDVLLDKTEMLIGAPVPISEFYLRKLK